MTRTARWPASGRAFGLAAALVGLLAAAGCVNEPDFAGRACASTAPCPEPFVCGADGTCHAPCEGDEECLGDAMCMSGLCLEVNDNKTCAGQSDCAPGEICRAGLCEPEGSAGCATAADCVTPGICQVVDGVICDAGRCLYPPTACDTPPAPECAGADDLFRTYGAGGCQAATGECAYAATDTPCANCAATCLEPCRDVTCPDEAGGCRVNGRCEPGAPGQAASCAYEDAADGTTCTRPDGGEGACSNGACAACVTAADCDDGNPCTTGTCDGATGACVQTPVSGTCDDGNACTTGDACSNGLCRGSGMVSCTSPPGECFAGTGTCDGATGQCTYPPRTAGDSCTSDGQACTQDVCDGAGSCTHPPSPSGVSCNDGDLCTYLDRCDGNGSCGGTALVCMDAPGVCGASRSCDGTAMCAQSFPGVGTSCDDSNACSHSDRCNGAGGCQGTGYTCDDGDTCTQDTCDGVGGCTNTPTAPIGLAPTGGATVSRQDVILVWGPCSNATEYELVIQYEGTGGTWRPYFTYTETVNNKTFYPCSSQSPGAPCNSNFRFRVRARTGGNWGPYAPWATFFWGNCRAC